MWLDFKSKKMYQSLHIPFELDVKSNVCINCCQNLFEGGKRLWEKKLVSFIVLLALHKVLVWPGDHHRSLVERFLVLLPFQMDVMSKRNVTFLIIMLKFCRQFFKQTQKKVTFIIWSCSTVKFLMGIWSIVWWPSDLFIIEARSSKSW